MNRKIRRTDRAVTDRDQIVKIIDRAGILHLGLIDDGFPYVVPLHFGYEYDRQNDMFIFYMHGAKTGHKLDLIGQQPNACVELETDVELASGGDDPCRYGCFYASVIGRGRVSVVDDVEQKKRALSLLMEHQTGRTFSFTGQMAAEVAVIRVEVRDYTAKARVKLS